MSGLFQKSLSHIGKQSEPRREIVTRRDIRNMRSPPTTGRRNISMATSRRPLSSAFILGRRPLMSSPPMAFHRLVAAQVSAGKSDGGRTRHHLPQADKPGDWLTATRTLTDIYEKTGRSGPLIFYEVMMEVRDDDGELVVSEKTTRILR